MNDLTILPVHTFIHAIGWTILHSLWQITLVALILRVAMLFLKNNSSSSRYNLSVAALLVVLVLSVTTFVNEFSNSTTALTAYENFQQSRTEIELNENLENQLDSAILSTLTYKFKSFYNKNLTLIVIGWNVCVLLLLLKLLGGLVYSQRMKRSRTSLLPEHIYKRLNHLARLIGLNKSVAILESTIVNVPVVIGYFKPVILMPVGIMTGLSSDQIEAIIAHELAHIKRNDYLINIFQSVIEILFFFHPAIWYISKTIRNERESACDDMAVANNTSRISLAKALTNIEIINHKKIEYAMAFTRNKYTLINRLKRIVNQQKPGFTIKDGFVTVLIIVVGLLIMSFSAKLILDSNENQNIKQTIEESLSSPDKALLDTEAATLPNNINTNIGSPMRSGKLLNMTMNSQTFIDDTIVKTIQKGHIEYSVKGILYSLHFEKDNSVTKFLVNNKSIAKADWKSYNKEIKLGFYLKEKHEKEMEVHEKNMEKHEKEMKIHEIEMVKHEKEMEKHEIGMEIHEKEMEEYDLKMEKYERELSEHDIDIEKYELNMEKHEKDMKQLEIEMEKHEKDMDKREIEMKKHEKVMKEHEKQMEKHEARMKLHEEKFAIIEELIEAMKKDNLIEKDAKSYSFSFSDTELKINGEKQTNKVFEKYMSLFNSKSKGRFKLEGDYKFVNN